MADNQELPHSWGSFFATSGIPVVIWVYNYHVIFGNLSLANQTEIIIEMNATRWTFVTASIITWPMNSANAVAPSKTLTQSENWVWQEWDKVEWIDIIYLALRLWSIDSFKASSLWIWFEMMKHRTLNWFPRTAAATTRMIGHKSNVRWRASATWTGARWCMMTVTCWT